MFRGNDYARAKHLMNLPHSSGSLGALFGWNGPAAFVQALSTYSDVLLFEQERMKRVEYFWVWHKTKSELQEIFLYYLFREGDISLDSIVHLAAE